MFQSLTRRRKQECNFALSSSIWTSIKTVLWRKIARKDFLYLDNKCRGSCRGNICNVSFRSMFSKGDRRNINITVSKVTNPLSF